LLQSERGDIPLDFLLGWIKVESNGNLHEVTSLGERGYFQLMKAESDDLDLQHERLSTDKNYSLRAGLRLATRYGSIAESYGFTQSDSYLFWRMVKLIHAMGPNSIRIVVSLMNSKGMPATSWESIKTFAFENRHDLLVSLKHDPVKWMANVDKVFSEGQVLVLRSETCQRL
jgi:hypothetical protein